jgi:hypothetical protein
MNIHSGSHSYDSASPFKGECGKDSYLLLSLQIFLKKSSLFIDLARNMVSFANLLIKKDFPHPSVVKDGGSNERMN